MKGVRLEETRWPEPEPGQALVRVRTAGAGFPDLFMASGHFPGLDTPPFGLGEEVAGEVVAVAPGSPFAVGDQIMGITPFFAGWGGYADYAYVLEQSAIRIPVGMTDEQAGGFPIGFRTAYAALVERAPVEAGQTLLVLGGAGSSGVAATQLGKALGATVIAVAGSDDKVGFCARHGADHVVNYRTADLVEEVGKITDGRGVDVIFDPVGGDTAARAISTLARYGRIAVVGLAAGTTVPIDSLDLLLRNYSAVGVFAGGHTPEEDAAAWGRLSELAEQKAITTSVGTVFSFDDVPAMISGQGSPPPGKSVVRVSS
ncbi:NADPH:quinone oxidoreductase family protein [Microbispora sp. RL4-1S]|uniref:NADPH:quinone oxidoreductase family protein n=1 Tax=Microbispora oryzae TaxID=2806554 RepID=A0A940WBD4_9ACTN|nr:NADPH:quinone oxidoreductase family protein [Microbispora oryzae]MBP2702335.1 NADPH:quinone oxidoreductase family protein [Microbispora oryzae]